MSNQLTIYEDSLGNRYIEADKTWKGKTILIDNNIRIRLWKLRTSNITQIESEENIKTIKRND